MREALGNIEVSLEIEKCTEITNNLCDLFDADTSSADLESQTMEGLRFLWDQANILFDLIQGRPENEGRSGKDYFDGVKLGELAYELAQKLKARGLISLQEIALRIQLKAILQVQGHYHHIIGPAMLEHCGVLAKLGRIDEALDDYDCIIADFSWFLDEYDCHELIESRDDIIAVKSLDTALSLRMKHNVKASERQVLEDKLTKTRQLLSLV